jgi:hypothetical protein
VCWRSPLKAASDAAFWSAVGSWSEDLRSLSALDEDAQTDGFMHETDGFTYAIDEDGDLLWFISPGVYYGRRKREAEAAEPPAEPDS